MNRERWARLSTAKALALLALIALAVVSLGALVALGCTVVIGHNNKVEAPDVKLRDVEIGARRKSDRDDATIKPVER